MRQYQYTLTREHVHAHAADLLHTHLDLHDYKRTCPVPILLAVLFTACARLCSLTAACARLLRAPSDQTVRRALLDNLPDARVLLRRLNGALVADLPRALRRRPQPLAIDLVLIPYYGKPEDCPTQLRRGKPQAGTSRFYTYATAYVIRKGRRYTLALLPVWASDTYPDVLRRLLRQVASAGVRVRVVLLDRGFFSVTVVRYLQAARQPFVMMMPCRGRRPEHPQGAGGTQRLCHQKRSGWHTYRWTDAQGRTATVAVCVRVTPKGRQRAQRPRPQQGQGRYHARKGPGRAHAYWGWQPTSYRQVADLYRSRFAIETTYRQLHQARVPTCQRSGEVRLLLVGIALVLRNVWVWVHDEYLAQRRRGRRLEQPERLRFRALLAWLADVAEAWLGICSSTAAEVPIDIPLPPPQFTGRLANY
jgi:DDE family transposase